MAETDKVFAGSMPALYDRHIGPMVFEPYALDMADRVARLAPKRILEIAAGTGIVTRALARKLPGVPIIATDLNQPMLDHAAKQTPAGSAITWQQADAQTLPFETGGFDAVVCQFGAMFFPDKAKAYGEARRVLSPGGHFLFSVWGPIEENPISDLVSRAVAAIFPGDPPGFLARTPHGYHDVATITDTLRQSGFGAIHTETVEKRGRAPSARDPAIGFCQGSPLRMEIEARDKARLDEATNAAAEAVAARFGPGPIDGKMQAHVIEAAR
ncbi:MAG TPA: methyltransferase domain-containing protein [Stellaceae bacterium]|nr:methyltransferase domain-containing protein [Stellaceae bacterium]